MPRIRTIKPEFPQSESMGRVSREARLLFILLWTLVDDAGRTRAASRMLASLLYPYDDDAPSLIEGWISELEREDCVARYQVDGQTYLQVRKWLNHQKIDKPSASKIPAFDESSRILANPRERSSGDQYQYLDQDREGKGEKKEEPSVPLVLAESEDERNRGAAKVVGVIPCPTQGIVDAYHTALPTLPRVHAMGVARKRAVSARWREVTAGSGVTSSEEGLAEFAAFFARVAESPFLLGKGPPRRDTGRVWHADFDWLMNPTNFVRVIEGRYHGQRGAA